MSRGIVRSLAGILALSFLVACHGFGSRAEIDAELAVMPLGGDFALTSSSGPVTLASLRGHPVWLFFGYTSCPDACPTALSKLARARALLAERGCEAKVETLFISVDPDRDSPEALAAYVDYFGSGTRGATGTSEQLAAVAKKYGASWERVPGSTPTSYLINHSTYVYLLDDLGRVRHAFSHRDPPERIAELTAYLVRTHSCS